MAYLTDHKRLEPQPEREAKEFKAETAKAPSENKSPGNPEYYDDPYSESRQSFRDKLAAGVWHVPEGTRPNTSTRHLRGGHGSGRDIIDAMGERC